MCQLKVTQLEELLRKVLPCVVMAFFEWLSFGCWLHFTHSTRSVTHILAVCVCVCVCVDVCLGGGWLCVYDVCAMGVGECVCR